MTSMGIDDLFYILIEVQLSIIINALLRKKGGHASQDY